MNQGCPSYLIEHGDEVDVPLVHLGVGGAGDEGGVVVHRHRGLQVVHDPGGVGHRRGPHHHGRNLKKQDQMTHLVREEILGVSAVLMLPCHLFPISVP